jgi:hypothetical protein
MITIHSNIEDYTLNERLELEDAYNKLEVKSQGGKLTIDETRIRVAYVRLRRESDFKISQASVKKVKEPKQPKAPGEKVTRTRKPKVQDNIAKASILFHKQFNGGELTKEEKAFLDDQLAMPPPPNLTN